MGCQRLAKNEGLCYSDHLAMLLVCFLDHGLSLMLLFLYLLAGKPMHTVNTKGENINICWSPNGHTIAVGNKVHAHV